MSRAIRTDVIRAFEDARPHLLGLAYRILGSRADAEDAVQDTYVKWADADHARIENPRAWLGTACTRRCLDLLRSAHRRRVDYVGAWLPEPVHTPVAHDADSRLELASSLTMAFLLVLERLTPKERAAYLLHDIFDTPYTEIAGTLEIDEAACRKLVSRARGHIDRDRVRHRTPPDRQDLLVSAFRAAITNGETARLADLLSDDVRLSADGGGKVPAVLEPLEGRDAVLSFVSEALPVYWESFRWIEATLNGVRGFVLQDRGETVSAVSFAYDENGRATDIFIVRNPDKLAALDAAAIH